VRFAFILEMGQHAKAKRRLQGWLLSYYFLLAAGTPGR